MHNRYRKPYFNLGTACHTLYIMCEDTCQFKHANQWYVVLFFGCNKLLTFSPRSYREKNIHYAELCKNRMGNDKYVIRSMQTFNGAPKSKQIQSDKIVMVDEG